MATVGGAEEIEDTGDGKDGEDHFAIIARIPVQIEVLRRPVKGRMGRHSAHFELGLRRQIHLRRQLTKVLLRVKKTGRKPGIDTALFQSPPRRAAWVPPPDFPSHQA